MKKTMFFLSTSLHHKKFRDRLAAAIDADYHVVVIAYNKGHIQSNELNNLLSEAEIFLVGSPPNSNIIMRLLQWPKVIFAILNARRKFGVPDVLLVNSAEYLVLGTIFLNSVLRKIYDLADINPLQYGDSLFSKIFRQIESFFLGNCWEVVVTSPWFYWEYINAVLCVKPQCTLIENKLIGKRNLPKSSANKYLDSKNGITIGWTGILRCNRSFELLLRLCELNPHVIKLHLIGVVDYLRPELCTKASAMNNVQFMGIYNEEEIDAKFEGVDYLWGCDFSDGLNSKLLLPNRLYQGIFYAKPIIAEMGTATGKVVDYLKVGVVITDFSSDELIKKLLNISSDQYSEYIENCTLLRDKVVRKNEWSDYLEGRGEYRCGRLTSDETVSVVLHD